MSGVKDREIKRLRQQLGAIESALVSLTMRNTELEKQLLQERVQHANEFNAGLAFGAAIADGFWNITPETPHDIAKAIRKEMR
jgi:hypothetical protein